AGAIRSSLRDMIKYLASNLNGSGPIGEDAKMAQTPRRPAQGAGQIGLAWPIAKSGVVWHNGQTGGYHAFIGFSADRTRGIVLMTNAATTIDDIGIHWLDPSVPLVKTYAALALDPKLLAKYVGSYMITIGPNSVPFVVSLQNGRLYTKLGQQPALAIYPYGQNAFFLRVMDAQIDFTADASGAITGFVLHQNGQNVTGTRTGS
ncbi:MAG: DUF3471 domain-containing protein, partial [Candidatus Eremiobacteraeota bacterium]|nr:DUF3471 domain-containing protein [Candidatus Eremiobacteraeota bacterium]